GPLRRRDCPISEWGNTDAAPSWGGQVEDGCPPSQSVLSPVRGRCASRLESLPSMQGNRISGGKSGAGDRRRGAATSAPSCHLQNPRGVTVATVGPQAP